MDMYLTTKKIYIAFLSVLLIASIDFNAYSQSNIGVPFDADLSQSANVKVYPLNSFDTRDKSYDGTPLLFEEWTQGRIKLRDNKDFLEYAVSLNFDLFNNTFLLNRHDEMFSLANYHVDKVKVWEENEEVTYLVALESNVGLSLFKVVVEGELTLLSKPCIKISKPYYNAALDVGTVRPKIKHYDTFYLLKGDKLYELPEKRKDLKKKLKGLSSVTRYLEKEKVDLKKESKLEAAITYLNKKQKINNEIN